MRILHVAASLSSRRGGPSSMIAGLTGALARQGAEVSVFAVSDNEAPVPMDSSIKLRLFNKNGLSSIWPYFSRDMAEALRAEVKDFDVIHIHELWHYPHYAASRAALRYAKPYLVTVHGMLDPWCLNHKAFKKMIFSALLEKRILSQSAGLHAVAEKEVDHIRCFVDHRNIFYIPNAIEPSGFRFTPDTLRVFSAQYPELDEKKVVLFLGRLHPIKGLDLLARAFAGMALDRQDVHLLIVGPDSDGYKGRFMEMLKSAGVLVKTTFTGILEGEAKLSALARADIFVLPSYSEGFSMSILEAMFCRLPVVITRGCNFPEVESSGAGLVVASDDLAIGKAVGDLIDNPALRQSMGERGYKLVLDKFTWDKIASQMLKRYCSVLRP